MFPKFLYRYRPADTGYFETEIKQAVKANIYLTRLTAQNDPFEGEPAITASSIKEIRELLKKREQAFGKGHSPTGLNVKKEAENRSLYYKRNFKHLTGDTVAAAQYWKARVHKINKDHLMDTQIACFSETANSVLMWSHYSQQHQGVCLKYTYQPNRLEARPLFPVQVRYKKNRPKFCEAELLDFMTSERLPDSEKSLNEELYGNVFDGLYLTKGKYWSYEREWRIISADMTAPGYIHVPVLQLDGVILGAKSSEVLRQKLETILPSNITVIQSRMAQESFDIEVPE